MAKDGNGYDFEKIENTAPSFARVSSKFSNNLIVIQSPA